jgi:hypothetical protein
VYHKARELGLGERAYFYCLNQGLETVEQQWRLAHQNVQS